MFWGRLKNRHSLGRETSKEAKMQWWGLCRMRQSGWGTAGWWEEQPLHPTEPATGQPHMRAERSTLTGVTYYLFTLVAAIQQ